MSEYVEMFLITISVAAKLCVVRSDHVFTWIHTWNDRQHYKLLPSLRHHHPEKHKLLFSWLQLPKLHYIYIYRYIYVYVYICISADSAWQIENSITETNTYTLVNYAYAGGFILRATCTTESGWRCVVYTNCLFSWAALNLIRPQTLMLYSPVARNGLGNAMKFLSLSARTPICIRLNGLKAAQNGPTEVMASVVVSAGLLMRPQHSKEPKSPSH